MSPCFWVYKVLPHEFSQMIQSPEDWIGTLKWRKLLWLVWDYTANFMALRLETGSYDIESSTLPLASCKCPCIKVYNLRLSLNLGNFLWNITFFFFLLRKICTELTSVASLPLFFSLPKAPVHTCIFSCRFFWFFYVSHHHSMATGRQVVWFHSWELNPGCRSRVHQTLTARP